MDVNDRQEVVSVDQLKPAYLDIHPPQPSPTSDSQSKSSPTKLAEHSTDAPSVLSSKPPTTTGNTFSTSTTTRYSHHVHLRQYLN